VTASPVSKQQLINYGYARGITISFLFLSASGIMGHEDHVILRVVTCGVGIWGFVLAKRLSSKVWMALMGVAAVIFTPFLHPAGLGREIWVTLDIAVAVMLGASIFGLSSKARAGEAP
jgi:hypothetical protein